ncbi:mechanosensitive ion channel family protein [Aestuariibius insulae]|uniref:mechanosensitive ion channel family protein n=1 Tax=Aestuariibius insulae TaxID=2058287 RepID=UPI00398F75EB
MTDFFDQIWAFLPGPMRTQLEGYVTGFWKVLPQIVMALIFLIVVWLIAKLVRWAIPRLMARARFRRALIDVAVMVATVAIWLFGVLIAATIAFPTITVGKIFTAAGVGGLAIAFAAKDTLENFFAGLMLLIREPFSKGDFIDCEGFEGQVEDITIRETHVRQTDGQVVVAPNSMFFKNPVTILTAGELRRTTVICGVAYGEDVDKARTIIEDAVKAVDSVRDDIKDVQIFAQEFGASSINFEVTWWTGSTPLDIRQSRDAVVSAVKRALDDAGIEIPFPYRTLTFKEPLPIRTAPGEQMPQAAE